MLVDVKCHEHGVQELLVHNGEHLLCPVCGKRADRVWSGGATFRMDFRSGWDMGAGKHFYTKRDRENWMRESGSTRSKS